MTSLRSGLMYQPPSTTTRRSRPSEPEVLRLSELQEQTSALDLANHNLLLFLTCLDKDCRRRAGGLYLNQWGETPCLTNNVLPKMTQKHTHPLTLFLNILIPFLFLLFHFEHQSVFCLRLRSKACLVSGRRTDLQYDKRLHFVFRNVPC